MSSGFTDKSLQIEGREWGWFAARSRPFAEPGVLPNYGPDRAFELVHLALKLRIDPQAGTLAAEALVQVGPTPTGMGSVRLNLDEVDVASVGLVGDSSALKWRHDQGVLVIDGLSAACTLRVVYTARPERGLYFVGPTQALPDREWQVWSQCQDEDGHYFFPCIDHPSVKQPMDITLIAPDEYTTVSNGFLAEKSAPESGWTAWHWKQEGPIPAYLVNVIVAKLEAHSDAHGDLPLRYLVEPGTPESEVRRIFARTPEMIRCFESRYGVAYPWPRYDQIVVNDFIFGGMENVSATTLTDLTMADPKAAAEWDPDGLIAHELAHQWFGDLVTCQDWSQGWLNEGWATYSEAIWIEWERSADEAAYDVFCKARNYFGETAARYSRPVVTYLFREPIDVFDRHLYEKGGCILHTLRKSLGEKPFWAATKAYLQANSHSTVHTHDLQSAFERATGRNLDGFFHQWVHCAGFPELALEIDEKDGLLNVKLKQSQSGEQVPEAFAFELGLIVHGESDQHLKLPVDERDRSFAIPVSERPRFVTVDPGFAFLSRMTLQAPQDWLTQALAESPCSVMRIRAAEALAKIANPKAVAALADALVNQPAWWVRLELAGSLSQAGGSAAREHLIAALQTETHLRVRTALVKSLARFRGQVDEVLAGIVKAGDSSLFAEAEAAAILGRHQSPLAAQACLTLLDRPSWGEKLASGGLRGLGALREAQHLTLLLEHASANYPERHRAAAAGALGALADEVPAVRPQVLDCLLDLAANGGFRAKLAAIAALGKVRDPKALGLLGRLHGTGGDGRVKRSAYESMCAIREGRSSEDALQGLRGTVEKMEQSQAQLKERLDRLQP
jgi:aminopeptidase N